MDKDTVIYLLTTIFFSLLFSGASFAFLSQGRLRLVMEKKHVGTMRIVAFFNRHPHDFLSAMAVGNCISITVCCIFMAQIIENYITGGISNRFFILALQVVITWLMMLIINVLLPKNLFKANPNLSMRILALPLSVCYTVLLPISKLLHGISRTLLRISGMKTSKNESYKAFDKTDLDRFIQAGLENSDNKENIDEEVKIFQNALDFSNIKIKDCIVPRTEVVSIDLKSNLAELKNLFIESGISKIIVYDGNMDNVVGYIHSSEMFRNPQDWHTCIKKIPIVPETMQGHKLMKQFMQEKKTIAVVVDEFGGTTGIVSLEDLVEEIFGDIEDEHDNTSYICKKVGENEYVLSARLEIGKINENLGLDLPESDSYLTIGGLILNSYQNFPKLNETVGIGKYRFKILRLSATKIELVRMKIME